MVEIHDIERSGSSSYEHQQQNYSDANLSEIDEHTLDHVITSPPELTTCHYCDLRKCLCRLYQVNYYYNYGLARRKITLCPDCYEDVYGKGRKISSEIVTNAFTVICETIMNSATVTINTGNRCVVNYFDAVKRAFDIDLDVRAYLGENCSIDKNLRGLWSFTYSIVNGRERSIKVLNADPDNMLLSVDCTNICFPSRH